MALAAVIGGGIAFGTSLSAQPEPAAASKAATVPSALSAHFAALSTSESRGSTSTGSTSSDTKRGLEPGAGGVTAQFGLNPSLAREVTYGESHVWIVPGSAGICVEDEKGSGGCGSIAQALEGSVAVGVGSGEDVTVYGLVPNGNSRVVVHNANGSSEDVHVEHNVYIVNHSGAVSAEVIDGSGKPQTIELPK